jgi:3-deoxy-D-manno-octulosonic-acid transferase
MYLVYNLLLTIFAVFIIPFCLLKGKYRAGFSQRMGFYPPLPKDKGKNIWVHAVSVGEAVASASLVKGLKGLYPDFKIILSTVTITGNRIAKEKISGADFVIYFPFDFSWVVKRAFDSINPALCIIMETELWPNFLREANLRNIPVAVVNCRISEKSFGGYKKIRPFMKQVLKNVALFNVQTERDMKRIIALGAGENNVKVCGNIKYDHEFKSVEGEKIEEIKKTIGIGSIDKILIAGSTHPGEEGVILDLYISILRRHPDLRLIIAPRHIERGGEVEEVVRKKGLASIRKTELSTPPQSPPDKAPPLSPPFEGGEKGEVKRGEEGEGRPVIILDTIGELNFMYSIADIVFVGGSLIPHGGQNILEPAFYKKPVLFGKYMMNFQEIAREMVLSGGGIQVEDWDGLKNEVERLLNDGKRMAEMGEKGYQVIMRNRGALQRNLGLIGEMIKSSSPSF